jgi:hypothetical protein
VWEGREVHGWHGGKGMVLQGARGSKRCLISAESYLHYIPPYTTPYTTTLYHPTTTTYHHHNYPTTIPS